MRAGGHLLPACALALAAIGGCSLETEVWDPVPDPPATGDAPYELTWPPDAPLPPGFDTPPWLTMPAPGHIAVGWLTRDEVTAQLELEQIAGPTGPPPPVPLHRTVVLDTPARLHRVDLGPLPVASGFRYRVRLASGEEREGVFATPGQPAWRFVHLAEFHAPTESDEVARFAGAIRDFRPHLVVESGDMVNDGDDPDHWRDYLRSSAPWISNVILLPAHSNHANGMLGNATLRSYFQLPGNERWYLTRWGAVAVVTLDSTYNGPSPDIADQEAWLRETMPPLRGGPDAPEFVIGAWHYPACSSSYAGRSESRRWVIDHLLTPLVETGGVDLVLVGHDKYYERSEVEVAGRRIVHLMTNAGKLSPSTAGSNEPECTPVVTDTATRSLVLADVSPGQLALQVVDQDGARLDVLELGGALLQGPGAR